MSENKFHVILSALVFLSLLAQISADNQYSFVYLDLSPLPYLKPKVEELRGEMNISFPSALIEQIRIQNKREYIQLDKIRIRVGLEAFEGVQVAQFCLYNATTFGLDSIKRIFPLPNENDKWSLFVVQDESCLTHTTANQDYFKHLEYYLIRYMREPIFDNLAELIASGRWRFEGLYTVDLEHILLLHTGKLSKTRNRCQRAPHIQLKLINESPIKQLDVFRDDRGVSTAVKVNKFTRTVTQNGFHADVTYQIDIERRDKNNKKINFNECRVAAMEMLQDFQFYSVDELRANNINLMTNDKIDIEKSAQDAEQYLIGIEFNDKQVEPSSFMATLKTKMHFRYPPPGKQSYTNYKMLPPLAFIECADFTLASLQQKDDYYKAVIEKQSFLEMLFYSRSRLRWYSLRTARDENNEISLPTPQVGDIPVAFAGTVAGIAILLLSFLYLIFKSLKKEDKPVQKNEPEKPKKD